MLLAKRLVASCKRVIYRQALYLLCFKPKSIELSTQALRGSQIRGRFFVRFSLSHGDRAVVERHFALYRLALAISLHYTAGPFFVSSFSLRCCGIRSLYFVFPRRVRLYSLSAIHLLLFREIGKAITLCLHIGILREDVLISFEFIYF